MKLESDIALDPFPQGRFPSVHFKYIRVERRDGHGCVRINGFVCRRNVFRSKIQFAGFSIAGLGQAVHGETQVRQYLIVNDIVEKNGVRVEGIFRQDDAVVRIENGFVVANGSDPSSDMPLD